MDLLRPATAARQSAVRIRMLMGGLPWPLDSATHQRHHAVLRALARCGAVDLVALSDSDTSVPPEIADLCRTVVVQPRPLSPPVGAARWMKIVSEVWGAPAKFQRLPQPALRPETRTVLNGSYDLTWVARLGTALRLGFSGSASDILDLDDIEHRKLHRASTLPGTSLRRRSRLLISSRAWRRVEREALGQYGRVVVCSETDRQFLGSPRVAVVPNGVTLDGTVAFTPGTRGRMVFVGRMDYWPNEDAAAFFVQRVLPRIRASVPQAELWIVGANPSPAVRALGDGDAIRVTGRVDDVRPFVKASALAVVPIRIGGGTRIKILEALGQKVAVVSTAVGAEGLDLTPGEHLLIADTADAFADACIRLLEQEETRRRLADHGFERVRTRYDWSVIADSVSALVADVTRIPREQSRLAPTLQHL